LLPFFYATDKNPSYFLSFLDSMMAQTVIAALYHFVTLNNAKEMQPRLQKFCDDKAIKGTLLLAHEGINGTVAGSRESIDALLAYLKADPRLAHLDHKESYDSAPPFHRMKVRLKKEIVTLGIPGISPTKTVGTYVDPQDWNALISDPEVILIDTRNDYEYEIGTFKGAQDPKTARFRDFPAYVREKLKDKKNKRIAMFCTGGIRCEKASSFMLEEGFPEVYHLKGGILKYLETVSPEDSLWQGECFVFDSRVAVGNGLAVSGLDQCHGCRRAITEADKKSPLYIYGVCCGHCAHTKSEESKNRARERHHQVEIAHKRGMTHIGAIMPVKGS